MTDNDEAAYLKAREIEEREAAARASCMVRGVHLELADEYEQRAREANDAAGQDAVATAVGPAVAGADPSSE